MECANPLGVTIFPPVGPNPGSGKVIDRNGNELTNNLTTFTDTLGVTALTVSPSGSNPTVYTYTTSSGAPASVTVNYSSQTVQTNFGCPGVAEYGPQSTNLVSSIILPDSSSYSFTYEPTPGVAGAVTGRIHGITLPTGGTITYNYTGPNNGIECVDGTTSGMDRVTSDGTVSYTRSGAGSSWTTTILDASTPRNATTINFQSAGSVINFYETHRVVNQGPSTVLMQTDTCYNGATPPCSGTGITLPISEVKRYITLNNGFQGLTDTFLNSLGLPTETDEYDYGSGAHGSLLRKTVTTYATQTGIAGLPATITVQDGGGVQKAQQTFTYDQGTLVPTTGVPQHVAVSTPRGNLTTVAQWVSPTASLSTSFTYDDAGNALTNTDSAGNISTFDYTDNFADGINRNTDAYLTKVALPSTGAVNHVLKTQYDVNTGLVTKTTNLNNADTTYTYDALLRPLTTNFPDGGRTSVTYNSPTNISQSRLITLSEPLSRTAVLDSYGRISQQQLTSDPGGTDLVDTTYNSNGLVASISNPHRSTQSSTDGITQFAYDALGRVTTQTQPDLNTVQANYSNNCVTTTDEIGNHRETCSDALGRSTTVFEPDSTGGLTIETDAGYDVFNNAVSITQKGGSPSSADWRVRGFAYDGLSRLTQMTAPESHITAYSYTTAAGSVCAGDASLPCRITDARNITKTLVYDALNRLTGKTYSDSTAPVSYFYDQSSFDGLTISNGNGLRTGMSDASGETAWSFDVMGRVLTRQQTIGTVTKSISFIYNLDGSTATMTYPSGRVYTYGYNGAGEPTSVADTVNGISFFSSGAYNPPGQLTGGNHGAKTGWTGISLANSFNNRLEPTELRATSPLPLTLLDLAYSFDQGGGKNNGSVVQIANGRDSTRTVNYAYDQLDRLSSAATISPTWGDSYGYDFWGNLLQKNVTKGTAESMALTVNSSNQITNAGFRYDGAGNLLSDGVNSMTYDAENRRNPTSGTTFTYDGDGRRVKKSDGTLYWVDDNFRPLSLGTTSGSITKDFVFLGSKRIAFVALSTGNPYYYLSDHLGSTAVIGSGDGKAIEWEADYFPFGNERQVFTSSVSNPYQFTGYEYDSDSGYNYAISRFEAGQWGRFLSPDPYLGSLDIANPQSLNRYSYVLNNPLRLVDPLGLVCDFFDADTGELMATSDLGDEGCNAAGGTFVSDDGGGAHTTVNGGGDDGGGFDPCALPGVCDGPVGGPTFGGGGGGGGVPGSSQPQKPGKTKTQILQCASEFANNHSLAALFGAQNTFLGKLFGGNTFSGITDLGLAVAGKSPGTSVLTLGSSVIPGGARLGIPGGGPGSKGAAGIIQDAGLSAAFNSTVGASKPLTQLGISSSEAVFSSGITGAEFASGVGDIKAALDLAVFLAGVAQCTQ